MRVELGAGSLIAVLAAMLGLMGGAPAQVQTPSTSKAVGSNLPASSSSNKSAAGGGSAAATGSSDAKTDAEDPDPSAAGSVPQGSKAPAGSKSKVQEPYIVGVADSLLISVWKEPDFSGPVVVRPDGIITVPVVGDIHVSGLTTLQVQDLLTEKLKAVVTEPQVTVVVREIKSRKVYLVGKVGRPGAVLLGGHETVLQVIAEAGGPAQFSKPDKMYVLRTVGGHQKRIPFHYKKVLSGNAPDLELEVDDVIVVP
jgi:polysaccharide export outer membrane protein